MNTAIVFGVIDAQRGFMPAAEGTRLHLPGFGELPVSGAERIIAPTNHLLGAFAAYGANLFTSQDWHPRDTAHFSDEPDYVTTWPEHCVAGTPGAELHPDLQLPGSVQRFIKGSETLLRGEDDTSYSAYNAIDPTTGTSLPDWLRSRGVRTVYLGGVALDVCVRASAVELLQRGGFEVKIVTDASRGLSDESSRAALRAMAAIGIGSTDSDTLCRQLANGEL